MTQEQLSEVLRMSNKDFFLKYNKMLVQGVIHKAQYDKLLELRKKTPTTDQEHDVLAVFGGEIIA